MIDITDVNVEKIKVGKPEVMGDVKVYPLQYDGGSFNIKLPAMSVPFGIKMVSPKTHLLNFSFAKHYQENPTYHKFQEIDDHLREVLESKIPGSNYVNSIQFSLARDKETDQLVQTDHPPTFVSSLRTAGKAYAVQVESGDLKKKTMDQIDMEDYAYPGSYLLSAHNVPFLVEQEKKGKKEISLRFKLLKIKVANNVEDIDLIDNKIRQEFIEL